MTLFEFDCFSLHFIFYLPWRTHQAQPMILLWECKLTFWVALAHPGTPEATPVVQIYPINSAL